MKNLWLDKSNQRTGGLPPEFQKWAPILAKIPPNSIRKELAILLDNQNLINANLKGTDLVTEIFKRISIPLVLRIFNPEKFLLPELVSFRSFLGPAGPVRMWCPTTRSVVDETMLCKSRLLRPKFPIEPGSHNTSYANGYCLSSEFDSHVSGLLSPFYVDNEAEMTLFLAKRIRDQLHNEVIQDLLNHSGTVKPIVVSKDPAIQQKEICNSIDDMGSALYRKTGLSPSWAILPESMANDLAQSTFNTWKMSNNQDSLFYHGEWPNGLRFYSAQFTGKILMGAQAPGGESTYAFCPYVPLLLSPVIDPNTFNVVQNITTRFAKKLVRYGEHCFGKITIQVSGNP